MPLFSCERCKNIDNTALTLYWMNMKHPLCSSCDPKINKWHGAFPKEKFDDKKWKIERGDFIKLIDEKPHQ